MDIDECDRMHGVRRMEREQGYFGIPVHGQPDCGTELYLELYRTRRRKERYRSGQCVRRADDPSADLDADPYPDADAEAADPDARAVRGDDQSGSVQFGDRRDVRSDGVGNVGAGVGHDHPNEIWVLQHEHCDGEPNVGYDFLAILDDSEGGGGRGDGSMGDGGSLRRADVPVQRIDGHGCERGGADGDPDAYPHAVAYADPNPHAALFSNPDPHPHPYPDARRSDGNADPHPDNNVMYDFDNADNQYDGWE